ncbi:PH domain-containing protein [Thermoactinospora rubra]|uniref:PH domain-containing protein n=1 Tax=Thermoactinospora rubra TaxID=1088767 RepID=UPI000A119120|nr:PH domain-containing protein [Thermoactinospora rubra]
MTGPGAPAAAPVSRLSPRVLLIHPIRLLPSLLVPPLLLVFASGFSPSSYIWVVAGVAGTIVVSLVRWAAFTYVVAQERLEIRRGLLSRSVRTIPLERVRGVDVVTPPMHRLLGLAVLKIDTGAGGEEKEEAELDAVTLAEAERLRAALLRRAPQAAVAARGTGATESVIIKVPRRWLVYGPLSGAYLYAPFAVVGGAIGLVFQWGDNLGFGRDAALGVWRWLWDRPQLLLIVAVVLVIAMPFAGGAMYAVFTWDFTLRRRDGHLVAERGLITRRSVSLESARVRGYEIVDGLAERWAGVCRAWAIVTGLGDSRTRGQLLPDVPRKVAVELLADAVGPYTGPLVAHPSAARQRRLFRAVAPWVAFALAAAVLRPPYWGVAVAPALVLAGAGIPLGLDRYRSLGHGYDGVRLTVRSGSLRRAQAVVERRAVVGWRIRQTWFQRRAGVYTVVVGVGAGEGGYSAVDVSAEQTIGFPRAVTPEWLAPFLEDG